MRNHTCYLPNGHRISVTPIFGGYKFDSIDRDVASSFPTSWNIMLGTREGGDNWELYAGSDTTEEGTARPETPPGPFKVPTRRADSMFVSSMAYPPITDLKPTSAPIRQIAMVLWTTFWWYFHEPEPSARIATPGCEDTPEAGRVLVDWRLTVKPEGLLRGPTQMAKLERMGLVTSENPSIGVEARPGSFQDMFISQSSFWQLDPRVYLFTITASGTPSQGRSQSAELDTCLNPSASMDSLGTGFPFGAGPNTQGTYLPSYYPPPPLQFTTTKGIRHPIRQQAPRQGEVVYSRFIPSLGKYLTYRVAAKDAPKPGNTAWRVQEPQNRPFPNMCLGPECLDDLKHLSQWMNDPETTTELIRRGPEHVQAEFLEERFCSSNSFPLIGCLGNESFGYFEAYWVMEDQLGRLLGSTDLWDRALHCLIARKNFRSHEQVKIWLSSLVHYCFLSDLRTQRVLADVRADNHRFISLLEDIGFFKDCEVNFPHKRAVIMKIERGAWTSPGV